MNNNAKNKTKQIVGIGVMTAIIAVLSQITIPLPTHVPVTLQTFAVALAGYFRRVYRWIHLRIYRYGSSLRSWCKVLL